MESIRTRRMLGSVRRLRCLRRETEREIREALAREYFWTACGFSRGVLISVRCGVQLLDGPIGLVQAPQSLGCGALVASIAVCHPPMRVTQAAMRTLIDGCRGRTEAQGEFGLPFGDVKA